MDMDNEVYRFKVMLVCGILFLVSIFMSYGELQYMASGETVQANLINAYETTRYSRRGVPRHTLVVEYQFTDGERGVRKESDRVRTSWPLDTASAHVPIEYIPGSPGSSRLYGHTQMVWVYIFGASLLAMGFFCYKFWKFYKS